MWKTTKFLTIFMAMWYIYGEYKLNMNVRPHGIKNEQVLGKESILCGKHIVNVRQVIYFAPCTKNSTKRLKVGIDFSIL